MPTSNPTTNGSSVVVKPLDGFRVATASESAADFEVDFAPIFGRLYPVIYDELARLGIEPLSPTIAFYEATDDGRIMIYAGVPIHADVNVDSEAVDVRQLPPVDRGATLVHHGSMATVDQSFVALDQWITDAGETANGYAREIYHSCPPNQAEWVTELQFALA